MFTVARPISEGGDQHPDIRQHWRLMPPRFQPTSVRMKDETWDEHWVFRWALPASVVLHLLIPALLMFELPASLPQPQEEQAIKVDIVPPPKPPEKPRAEPSPPRQEPKPEKPQEVKAEKPPPANNSAPPQAPQPAVRSVVRFGEKDAGPRRSADGNNAEEGSASTTEQDVPDKQDLAQPPALAAAEAKNQIAPPGEPRTAAPKTLAPKAADAAKVPKAPKLREAKRLFSRSATGDPIATTAMNGMPRGARGGELCVAELKLQLISASPPYLVEQLPFVTLKTGTIIENADAAFHGNGQWRHLGYRCEVDTDATRVVSFAFGVGGPVPRSEWARYQITSP
jgi:hypothetical protein